VLVVFGGLFVAALCARPQSPSRIIPGPASFRQPGHPGAALAAAEVSWGGNLTLGSWEGFLLEGPGHFFHPSPGRPVTVVML